MPRVGRPDRADVEADVRADAVEASELSWALRALLVSAGSVNLVVARQLGMTLNDLAALDHLMTHGPLGPVELGQRLGMRAASATALVDRLEAAGHVRRRPHDTDRRRLRVEVTPRGLARSVEVMTPLIAELDAVAAGLPAEARDAVLSYLRQVEVVLRRHDAATAQPAPDIPDVTS